MSETQKVPAAPEVVDFKNQITDQITKPLVAVHDEDINLGHQLLVADAINWGRDNTVLKQISSSANKSGGGKGGLSGEPGSGNAGKNYGASSNSGDNSAMHSAGTSSVTGVPTDTAVGTRISGAASTESQSADANRQ